MDDKQRDPRAALRAADWAALLPRLASYAAIRLRRLGWAAGRDEEPSAASVEWIVNEAIKKVLEGSRTWNADDPPELGAFLCGVIKGIGSNERKKAARSKEDAIEGLDTSVPSPVLSAQEGLERDEGLRAICCAIQACTKGDEKLELYYLALTDRDTRRDDVAAALGWSAAETSAARIKLQRRLLAEFPSQFAQYKKTRVKT